MCQVQPHPLIVSWQMAGFSAAASCFPTSQNPCSFVFFWSFERTFSNVAFQPPKIACFASFELIKVFPLVCLICLCFGPSLKCTWTHKHVHLLYHLNGRIHTFKRKLLSTELFFQEKIIHPWSTGKNKKLFHWLFENVDWEKACFQTSFYLDGTCFCRGTTHWCQRRFCL